MFTGPLPWIGGDVALAMRPYPLALEGVGRFGDRATLITVTDAHQAGRDALLYTLTVFLAGLLPLMAGCLGLMLRLRQRLIPELLRLAQVDALSGVLNRRAFMETAADLLQRRLDQIGGQVAQGSAFQAAALNQSLEGGVRHRDREAFARAQWGGVIRDRSLRRHSVDLQLC